MTTADDPPGHAEHLRAITLVPRPTSFARFESIPHADRFVAHPRHGLGYGCGSLRALGRRNRFSACTQTCGSRYWSRWILKNGFAFLRLRGSARVTAKARGSGPQAFRGERDGAGRNAHSCIAPCRPFSRRGARAPASLPWSRSGVPSVRRRCRGGPRPPPVRCSTSASHSAHGAGVLRERRQHRHRCLDADRFVTRVISPPLAAGARSPRHVGGSVPGPRPDRSTPATARSAAPSGWRQSARAARRRRFRRRRRQRGGDRRPSLDSAPLCATESASPSTCKMSVTCSWSICDGSIRSKFAARTVLKGEMFFVRSASYSGLACRGLPSGPRLYPPDQRLARVRFPIALAGHCRLHRRIDEEET